jgi:hypothetical protein
MHVCGHELSQPLPRPPPLGPPAAPPPRWRAPRPRSAAPPPAPPARATTQRQPRATHSPGAARERTGQPGTPHGTVRPAPKAALPHCLPPYTAQPPTANCNCTTTTHTPRATPASRAPLTAHLRLQPALLRLARRGPQRLRQRVRVRVAQQAAQRARQQRGERARGLGQRTLALVRAARGERGVAGASAPRRPSPLRARSTTPDTTQ